MKSKEVNNKFITNSVYNSRTLVFADLPNFTTTLVFYFSLKTLSVELTQARFRRLAHFFTLQCIMFFNLKPAAHEAFSSTCFWDGSVLFAIGALWGRIDVTDDCLSG